MSCTELTTTQISSDSFYPTPPELAEKLLSGLDWDTIATVLEPSAGKGDLVRQAGRCHLAHDQYSRTPLNVDCVEIDPNLRAILADQFSSRREEDLHDQACAIRDKRTYDPTLQKVRELSRADQERLKATEKELSLLSHLSVHVIHDDFLSFHTRKHYDLIVMNPPFSDGDAHLLKAIELQRRTGGQLRCLLNAETLHNPYTNRRKHLKQQLDELGAEVEFLDSAFQGAERKTSVRVALIRLTLPAPQHSSDIFDHLRKAQDAEQPSIETPTDLAPGDFLERIVAQYNLEVEAGLALIQEYIAMRPNLIDSFKENGGYSYPTLSLCVGDPSQSLQSSFPTGNAYLHLVRKKYWEALFTNEEFVGQLTSNLREKYQSMMSQMENYDFTLFNIRQIMVQMNAEIVTGVKDTILSMFDKLSQAHAWYPETQKNIHYYNGWKTNKVHKVNSKVIIPTYGLFSSYSWAKDTFQIYEAERAIADIEKVFNYLDGRMTEEVSLHGVLVRAHDSGQTRNIPCKYFDVTLYKKGTMHIKFRNQALLDRFNIYVARNRNWLPPSYGYKPYSNMNSEEQAVVDDFQGREAYGHVMEEKSYFLADPVGELPALAAPSLT